MHTGRAALVPGFLLPRFLRATHANRPFLSVEGARERLRGVTVPRTVLISPALDLAFDNPRIPEVQPDDPWLAVPGTRVFADAWASGLDVRDPTVSPMLGELAGLGPITLFIGTHDPLLPTRTGRDARRRIVDAVRAAVR